MCLKMRINIKLTHSKWRSTTQKLFPEVFFQFLQFSIDFTFLYGEFKKFIYFLLSDF